MTKNTGSYGYIVVANAKDEKLKLTFTSRSVYSDALFQLERAVGAKVVEATFGLATYKTADAAIEDAKFWLGVLPKAA